MSGAGPGDVGLVEGRHDEPELGVDRADQEVVDARADAEYKDRAAGSHGSTQRRTCASTR
jgi:hypothetical protein